MAATSTTFPGLPRRFNRGPLQGVHDVPDLLTHKPLQPQIRPMSPPWRATISAASGMEPHRLR